MEGQEFVAAPHDSDGVGLEHDNANECHQYDDTERLRTELQQLLAPRQLLFLEETVNLTQVGQEVRGVQSVDFPDGFSFR